MTTSELIKLLQKEDPQGDCHVRIAGSMPAYVESKPGYWDGSYSYLDRKGNYVITTKGAKVDIITMDVEDFIWNNQGDYSKVKVDLAGYSGEVLEKKVSSLQEKFRKIQDRYNAFAKQMLEEHTILVLNKLKEGWQIIQPSSYPIGHYNVMWYVKNPDKFVEIKNGYRAPDNRNQKQLVQGDCGAVLKSGFFKADRKGKLIYWRLYI